MSYLSLVAGIGSWDRHVSTAVLTATSRSRPADVELWTRGLLSRSSLLTKHFYNQRTGSLSRDAAFLATHNLCTCAGAVVCLAAWVGISHLLKRFKFIGYNHSEK